MRIWWLICIYYCTPCMRTDGIVRSKLHCQTVERMSENRMIRRKVTKQTGIGEMKKKGEGSKSKANVKSVMWMSGWCSSVRSHTREEKLRVSSWSRHIFGLEWLVWGNSFSSIQDLKGSPGVDTPVSWCINFSRSWGKSCRVTVLCSVKND